MQIKNIIKPLIYEALFWLALPLCFLYFYVGEFNYPLSSVLPHLYFVTWFFVGLLTFKLLLLKKTGLSKLTTALVTILNTTWLFTSVIYYILVIVGLQSWGKVITTELIVSYTKQASNFANFLGIQLWLIAVIIALIYASLFLVGLIFTKKTQYNLNNYVKKSALTTILLTSLLLLSANKVYLFIARPMSYAYQQEPIALTLTQGKPQGHHANHKQGLANNPELNKAEKKIRESYTPNASALKKNVILIVSDALSPKHMGVYNYTRNTTPFLSKLKNESESYVFYNTRASCSESACGLISLASSRYVHLIPEQPFTLQQILKKHGYEINMVMGGDHTNFYGLKSLYDDVDSYIDGSMVDGYFNDDKFVLDHVKKLDHWHQSPLMIQIHLMSSHLLGLRWPNVDQYLPSKSKLVKTNTDEGRLLSKNHYDNGVLQSDLAMKELINSLKSKGYLNNALIIVTADHGESLGEHDKWTHGTSVYEEQLQIPLLVFNYGQPITMPTNQNNNTQVDIAPMILCALNMPVPENWSGQACNKGVERNYSYFLNDPYTGLIDHSDQRHLWKYWKDSNTLEEYVFDVMQDPNENNNLFLKIPTPLIEKWRKTIPTIE